MAFAVEGVVWLDTGEPSYADWYFVDDFAALGVLNDAAIADRSRAAHDEIAAMTGRGVAGLYALHRGDHGQLGHRRGTWLRKPPGKGYEGVREHCPAGDRR